MKKVLTSLLALVALSHEVNAVTLTSYRVYLDDDNNRANFLVLNQSTKDEQCKIGFEHHKFDENGKRTVDPDKRPSYSALPYIRYSPKSFSIKAGERQNIQFVKKRSLKRDAAEYNSVFSLACTPDLAESSEYQQVRILQTTKLNIPLVVRDGKLDANIDISLQKLEGNKIKVNVNRTGNRSVYGRLELIDTSDGDKVVSFINSISIYKATKTKEFSFSLPSDSAKYIVKFTEIEGSGGNLSVSVDVI